MIGSAIRKFAKERGLTCSDGYAYGLLHGLHIAMDEGSGWKAVNICLYPVPEDVQEKASLQGNVYAILTNCDLKEYRLTFKDSVVVQSGFARLRFHDTIGAMKHIVAYLDEMLPKIAALGLNSNRCAYCGGMMDGDLRYVLLSGSVFPVHSACVEPLSSQIDSIEEEDIARSGSVLLGAAGALFGSVLGAVVWALVYSLGYIAGIVGFVIGFLANFFYGKFGGKRSGLRIVIVVLALVVGSVLGQVGGMAMDFMNIYDEMGFQDEISRMDWFRISMEQYLLYDQETALGIRYDRELERLPEEEREYILTREEYIEAAYNPEVVEMRNEIRAGFIKDLGIGLIFGFWGCFGLFKKVHNENKRRKVKPLG